MKKTVFGFLAVVLLVATALPALGASPAPPAPSAAQTEAPVWLAGLTPAAAPGLSFLPKPILVTACSFPTGPPAPRIAISSVLRAITAAAPAPWRTGASAAECLCQ